MINYNFSSYNVGDLVAVKVEKQKERDPETEQKSLKKFLPTDPESSLKTPSSKNPLTEHGSTLARPTISAMPRNS